MSSWMLSGVWCSRNKMPDTNTRCRGRAAADQGLKIATLVLLVGLLLGLGADPAKNTPSRAMFSTPNDSMASADENTRKSNGRLCAPCRRAARVRAPCL